MRFFHAVLVVAATAACLAGAEAKDNGPSLKDRQQAACYNDVQRLCGATLPDVDKTTACMKDKRPQVSAGCSKMWDVKG